MRRARIEIECKMAEAKARFTVAAKASLAGDPDAPRLAQDAYAEVVRALSDLAALRQAPEDV